MVKGGYYNDNNSKTNGRKNHPNESLKTESLTCRLDKITLNKLKTEAQQKEVSVNTLINQTLRHHSDWHSNAAKAGFISVRRGLIMKLMEKISEDELTGIAEYIVKKDTKDFVLMLRNEYNIESALDVLETWIKIAGYPYRHEVHYDRHSYTIQHEMGRRWSLDLKEQYRFLFEEFGLGRVMFDITDNTLSFTVDTLSLI